MKGKYSIPGWLYLIFGAIITGYSQFLLNSKGLEKNTVFQFFFYVGLIFIAIGIFKLIIRYALGEKKKKIDNDFAYGYNLEKTSNNQNNKYKLITCPKCQAKNYKTYNFCYKCGSRLR